MKNIDQDAVRMTDLEKYVAVGLGGGQWTEVYHWGDHGASWQSSATCLCSRRYFVPIGLKSTSAAV